MLFFTFIFDIRKKKKYLLSHIENMDETPVMFDMVGNKTIDVKGKKRFT